MTTAIERAKNEFWFLLGTSDWGYLTAAATADDLRVIAIAEMREEAREGAEGWGRFLDEKLRGWHLEYYEWRNDDGTEGTCVFGVVILVVYDRGSAHELQHAYNLERVKRHTEAGILQQIAQRQAAWENVA